MEFSFNLEQIINLLIDLTAKLQMVFASTVIFGSLIYGIHENIFSHSWPPLLLLDNELSTCHTALNRHALADIYIYICVCVCVCVCDECNKIGKI
jgi:hypothetical protein